MTEERHAFTQEAAQPEKRFLSPVTTVILTLFIYFAAQVLAALLVAMYPASRGYNDAQTDAWLNTYTAKFWVMLLFGASTIGLLWSILQFKKFSFKKIGLNKPRLQDIWYALLGFMAYFAIYIAIAVITKLLFPSINFEQKQEIGFEVTKKTGELVLVFISLVVLPPIIEETLTRGFLYTGLRSKLPTWAAALVTSILFAMAHLQFGNGAPLLWVAAIDTFSLSIVLIYLREKTGGLSAPMFLHGIKNGLAFLFIFIIGS